MPTPTQRPVVRNDCSIANILSLPNDPFTTYAEWSKDVASSRKPQSALVHVLFIYGAFGRSHAEALIKEYINKKAIKKEDLIELFLIESNSFLTIKLLSDLQFKNAKLFSFDELFNLEEKRFGVKYSGDQGSCCCDSDIAWTVRNETRLSLIPSKTLARWRESVDNLDDELLIRIEIKKRFASGRDKDILKDSVSGKQLMWKLRNHIKNGSGINSVKHYLVFIFSRSRRKGSLRQDVFDIVQELLLKGPINKPECEFAFQLAGWYINNPQIPSEDRDWLKEQVKLQVDQIIKRYKTYLDFERRNFLSFDR